MLLWRHVTHWAINDQVENVITSRTIAFVPLRLSRTRILPLGEWLRHQQCLYCRVRLESVRLPDRRPHQGPLSFIVLLGTVATKGEVGLNHLLPNKTFQGIQSTLPPQWHTAHLQCWPWWTGHSCLLNLWILFSPLTSRFLALVFGNFPTWPTAQSFKSASTLQKCSSSGGQSGACVSTKPEWEAGAGESLVWS